METLEEVAARSDAAVRRARQELVDAVRAAHLQGATQAEIARSIGRSQPEVSRLLRFHGSSARGMALRRARRDVLDVIKSVGGEDVRVFGSVARGTDADESDIDVLFAPRRPIDLMDLADLDIRLSELVGFPVEAVPSSDLRETIRERVMAEAVPL